MGYILWIDFEKENKPFHNASYMYCTYFDIDEQTLSSSSYRLFKCWLWTYEQQQISKSPRINKPRHPAPVPITIFSYVLSSPVPEIGCGRIFQLNHFKYKTIIFLVLISITQ